jgi:hypothetical protein
MKIFRKEDEIDVLEEKQRKLEAAKEEKTSKINLKNNKIGAKVKRLEEKMFQNRTTLSKFTEKIDLELEKNAKLIIAASEYAQKLGAKYKKPTTNNKLKDALDNAEIKKDIKDIKDALTKKPIKKTNKK